MLPIEPTPKELDWNDVMAAFETLPPGEKETIEGLADRLEMGLKRRAEMRSSRSAEQSDMGGAKIQFGRKQALETLAKLGLFMRGKEYRP